jgi:beta propeller repeat protein
MQRLSSPVFILVILRMSQISLGVMYVEADGEFIVASSVGRQHTPAIWGDWVVWADRKSSDAGSNIYAHNLSTNETLRLNSSNSAAGDPDIYDGLVVWSDRSSGNSDIYQYDLKTRIESALYVAPGNQINPAIHGDTVVWRTGEYPSWPEVWGYSIAQGAAFLISDSPGNKWHPDVFGDIVVWGDYRNDNWDIYGYDLSTHTEFEIASGPVYQRSAAIYGDKVAYEHRHHGVGIYDLTTGENKIHGTHSGGESDWIAIYGSIVVWGDIRDPDRTYNIYGYDIVSDEEFPICVAPDEQYTPATYRNMVVWSDDRCGGYWEGDIYGNIIIRSIYVDDDGIADFNNIQAAINDSNDGDSIIVQPGLYRECVRFHGKNIIVRSTNPGDFNVVGATVIDYGVSFVGTEDANCALLGFKINGRISGVDYGIDPAGENHTHATISNCLFVDCYRVSDGRVIRACDGTISNCVIADNRARGDVISSAISECHGLIKNCTIANNELGVWVGEGMATIDSCIIYHNSSGQIGVGWAGTVNILHSDVEGGPDNIFDSGIVNWGPGNTERDPCFVRVGDWLGQSDGEYHLKSEAGRWDPNGQTWVQDDVTSPCIDAGDPMSPIGQEPFPNGGVMNMGAYGGTGKASKSYFGQPVCETIVAGDINGDCTIDFLDLVLMSAHWLEDNRIVTAPAPRPPRPR